MYSEAMESYFMTTRVNGKDITAFVFSGGECQVKIPPASISATTQIVANLYNANDIMCLLLTVDAIRRIDGKTSIELHIPYFPYARQDRVCDEGEALSVKVMADLINSLNCQKVTIVDPHSDVTPALLKNVFVISMADIIVKSSLPELIEEKQLILLSPDAGAEKKVRTVAKALTTIGVATDIICASKARDTKTGAITATHIHGDVRGKNILMLDDICDGGRTFIELAKTLKTANAGDIYLYTTHGIYSQGLEPIKPYFKHLYCFHTMLEKQAIDTSFLTLLGNA